jgi:hypothetical protein
MRINFKKLFVAVLAMTLVISCVNVNSYVKAATGEATAIVISELLEKDALVLTPGQTKHIILPIKSIGGYMNDANVTVKPGNNSPFTISQVILSEKGNNVPFFGVSNYGTTYVEFDVSVKETAAIGSYPTTVTVTALNNETGEKNPQSLDISFQILKEMAPAQITVSEVAVRDALVGSETNIFFKIKNEGEITARNAYLSLDFGTSGITPKYETPRVKLGDVEPAEQEYMSLPVSILSTTTEGLKTIKVNLDYKDVDGKEGKDSYEIFVTVEKNEKAPALAIASVSYNADLVPGNKVTMVANIENGGELKAENINVKVDEASTGLGADGLIKNYFTDSIWVGSIKSDGKGKVSIPLTVSKQATGGMKKLNLILTYTDTAGVAYTTTTAVYPEIIAASESGNPNIIISGVKQSLAQPIAGEKLEVSFDIENKSKLDISELKILTDTLTGSTFIPINAEPYQYVEKLAAGAKKRVTIPLIVSDSIPEGLNNLTIKYTYSGNATGESVIIPVRDVQNDLGSKSKPKLIVSKYVTDTEELRAGSTFNFTFDIHNTHSSVAAKNITVTVTQADNVFTVSQGSNSFFINKIEAGETVQQTMEMKVKSDATTKAYPIKIAIEYEYDGAEPNPTTGEIGESKTEELNLQAIENSRPVVDNVNVYSWDGNVMASTPATLSFEFYNMGRSPLNNVIATIEGDFTKTDGNMYFIGNVAAGTSSYVEYEVMPNMEGLAKGVLKITFEDSNGDEVEFTKEFEAQVMPASVIDPGMVEGGVGEVFNPEGPLAKKAILPIWLFVIIQLIIFAAFIPITRKIIIGVYKSKLRKKEQEQY